MFPARKIIRTCGNAGRLVNFRFTSQMAAKMRIKMEWIGVFYGVQIGIVESQEFRTMPIPQFGTKSKWKEKEI
jgi:hypothetical protein